MPKTAARGEYPNATIEQHLQRATDLADDLSREVTRACRSSGATSNMADAIVRELTIIRELLDRNANTLKTGRKIQKLNK